MMVDCMHWVPSTACIGYLPFDVFHPITPPRDEEMKIQIITTAKYVDLPSSELSGFKV